MSQADGVDAVPGAYGLRFAGLDEEPVLRDALMSAPGHWPAVSVQQNVGPPPPLPFDVTADWARIPVGTLGHALLDRHTRKLTLWSQEPIGADTLVHPTLAVVSAIFSSWLGRPAIHAGAAVVQGGAWALVGGKETGKSSTLGWLAQAGIPILADDLVVIDGNTAFAGPRSLDLVPASAQYLGHDGHDVRRGERQRVAVQTVDPEVPLRGWIALSWGEFLDATLISPAERLGVLVEQLRPLLHGPAAGPLLELAALPGYRLCRPRRLDALPDAGAKIVELATA